MKIETIDRVCLIAVKSKENNMICLNSIKEELAKQKIKLFYSSASSLFGNGKNVLIAINENDMYPLLEIMGNIRENAQIANYSINCSNSLIFWKNSSVDVTKKISGQIDKIKLLCENGRNGIIVCENQFMHAILSRME